MEYITANTLIENGEINHFVRLEDDKMGDEYILDVDQNILFLLFYGFYRCIYNGFKTILHL